MSKSVHKRGKKSPKLSADDLRQKLKLKHLEVKQKLSEGHPHIDKYLKSKGFDPGKIRERSTKFLGAGFLTGSLLLSGPSGTSHLPTPNEVIEKLKMKGKDGDLEFSKDLLASNLRSLLPKNPRPLIRNEEKLLEQIFDQALGLKAKASLEGEHLNTTYGYIGIEQHLRRYPGDTLSAHGSGAEINEGIAPGLGAWGYFAPSKSEMNKQLEETEKWYAVVQTLYLPDWNKRQPHLKDWYKFRKVLIVNSKNGNAVVAAIADSGPAAWTGKHFGGSPEVMNHLGGPRYKKGSVVMFFVDDPENKIPLGPVK
ncbi:MAG: hypothetical protein ACW99F_19450 [Candidatus Hodarchaeales archaeon]|jgi:hypothetical protein